MPVPHKMKFYAAMGLGMDAARKGQIHYGIVDELSTLLHEHAECQPQFPLSSKLFRVRVPQKPADKSKMAEYKKQLETFKTITRLSNHFERTVTRTPHGNFILIEFK